MADFWEGLEESSAFSYTYNEKGEPVQASRTLYSLFTADGYPFVVFEDELRAVNDYCCEAARAVRKRYITAKEAVREHKEHPAGRQDPWISFTPYEVLMGLETEQKAWEWLYCDILEDHLIELLYAFAEKCLKRIWRETGEKKPPAAGAARRPKLLRYLCAITGVQESQLAAELREAFQVLEAARRRRNQFAHGEADSKEGGQGGVRLPAD